MKARLVEEVAKEDMRATQLESLLEAFQSAVGEKEQLIILESQILSEIREVKTKVTDEIILNELSAAIEEKSRLIDAERAICKEISAVSSSLASEVNETREKIAELQKVIDVLPEEANAIVGAMEDYQTLLKSSIEVTDVFGSLTRFSVTRSIDSRVEIDDHNVHSGTRIVRSYLYSVVTTHRLIVGKLPSQHLFPFLSSHIVIPVER